MDFFMSMFMFLRVIYHGLILNAYNKTFVVEILSTIKIRFLFFCQGCYSISLIYLILIEKKDFREPHGKIYKIHYFLFPTLSTVNHI